MRASWRRYAFCFAGVFRGYGLRVGAHKHPQNAAPVLPATNPFVNTTCQRHMYRLNLSLHHVQVLMDQLINDHDAAGIEADWGRADGLTKEGAWRGPMTNAHVCCFRAAVEEGSFRLGSRLMHLASQQQAHCSYHRTPTSSPYPIPPHPKPNQRHHARHPPAAASRPGQARSHGLPAVC